jgi:tetratricopeptide (TPR) repeat protein
MCCTPPHSIGAPQIRLNYQRETGRVTFLHATRIFRPWLAWLFALQLVCLAAAGAEDSETGALLRPAREMAERGDFHGAHRLASNEAERISAGGKLAPAATLLEQALIWLARDNATASSAVQRRNGLQEVHLHYQLFKIYHWQGRQALASTAVRTSRARLDAYLARYISNPADFSLLTRRERMVAWQTMLYQAIELRHRGRFPEAEDLLQRIIFQVEKTWIKDEKNGATWEANILSRAFNDLAVIYWDKYDLPRALELLERALAVTTNDETRRTTLVNIACLRRQMDGATPELIATLRAQAAAADPYSAIDYMRSVASMLKEIGKNEEADQIYASIMETAARHGYPGIEISALFWRATDRISKKQLEGVEADLIKVLIYYRERGLKLNERDVYQSYGLFLLAQGRRSEAVQMLKMSVALSKSFRDPCRAVLTIAIIAEIQIAGGTLSGTRAAWAEIDALLAENPKLPLRVEFDLGVLRLAYLKAVGEADALAKELARLQALSKTPGLTKSQLAALDKFDRTPPTAPIDRSQPAEVPQVDLQPVEILSYVLPQERARARFTLSNPGTTPVTGRLRVASARLLRWDADQGLAEFEIVPHAAPEAGVELTVSASDQVVIFLNAASLPKGSDGLEPTLTWLSASGEKTSRWQLGQDVPSSYAVINANALRLNPFYAVPIYHEIVSRQGAATTCNLRIKGSSACRIELFDPETGEMIAADANGNGSFRDPGDLLFRDEDSDGFPDLRLEKTHVPRPIELLVFPVEAAGTKVEEITLSFELRDPDWTVYAVDKLLRDAK